MIIKSEYTLLILFFIIFTGCKNLYSKNVISPGLTVANHPGKTDLKRLESEVGFKPLIVNFFISWPDIRVNNSYYFPKDSINNIISYGSIPCITWEPMYYVRGREVPVLYSDILSGRYDDYLKYYSENIKSFKEKIIIRFAHEMNIIRYHWGTKKEDFGPESPEIYKKMYKYIVDFFRKNKVENILWVFCPNSESVPLTRDSSWNSINNYFPGNEYVDIIGIDGYNWGNSMTIEKNSWKSHWKPMKSIFKDALGNVRKLSEKPVIIFELASCTEGGDKKKWLDDMNSWLEKNDIYAFCWFEVNKELDWRLNSGLQKKYIWTNLNKDRKILLKELRIEEK